MPNNAGEFHVIRYSSDSFLPIFDDNRISIRRIKPPLSIDLLLVIIHLQSKLYMTEDDQNYQTIRLAEMI